jgi:hypothetical protein
MVRVRELFGRYGVLCTLLALVALGSAATISSCGGNSSGTDGFLCQQCGATDGPCQDSVEVSGSDAATLCGGQASCQVALGCFRQLDSAQRRCFPADPQFELFECDGGRALRPTPTATATPTVTPTGTLTPTSTAETPTATAETPTATAETPTATAATSTAVSPETPTPTPTTTASTCGNGVIEGDEECDGGLPDPSGCVGDVCTCEDFCDDAGGSLSCTPDCTVNVSKCTAGGCVFS